MGVGKAAAASRLATAAAYGGGGLGALGGVAWGLLRAEAAIARRLIGVNDDPVPDCSGWFGRWRDGEPVRIALLGDSSAAGYGVERVGQVPGSVLAASVSEQARRPVLIKEFCRVGARSEDLAGQVERALPWRPDVVVILVGANDVTHTVLPAESVAHLGEAVRRLREAGAEVVVGTCPDLGTIRPIPVPLRQVARLWSRRLAAAQTITVVAEGGRTVALASLLGPEFAARPTDLFGPDRFHPSAEGYAALAGAMVPAVLAVLGVIDDEDVAPSRSVTMSLPEAAAAAARTPGSELDADAEETRRGLAHLLLRRLRPAAPEEGPEDASSSQPAPPARFRFGAKQAQDTEPSAPLNL